MREANGLRRLLTLGEVVGNGGSGCLAALVGLLVVGDFLAVR